MVCLVPQKVKENDSMGWYKIWVSGNFLENHFHRRACRRQIARGSVKVSEEREGNIWLKTRKCAPKEVVRRRARVRKNNLFKILSRKE